MNERCLNCLMCPVHCDCENDAHDIQSEDMGTWRCSACVADRACMDGNAAADAELDDEYSRDIAECMDANDIPSE